MRHRLMTVLWLLCLPVLLMACAQPELIKEVETVRMEVPAPLLDCPQMPQPPTPNSQRALTQRNVATFVVNLWAAGSQCRDKLLRVRGLVNPTGAP